MKKLPADRCLPDGCDQDMSELLASAMIGSSTDGAAMIYWDPRLITLTLPRGARPMKHVSWPLLSTALHADVLWNALGAEDFTMDSSNPVDKYAPPAPGGDGGQRHIAFIDYEFTRSDLGIDVQVKLNITGRNLNLGVFDLKGIKAKFASNCTTANVYVFPCSATADPTASAGDDTSPRVLLATNNLWGVSTMYFVSEFVPPIGLPADKYTLTRRFFDTTRNEHLAVMRRIERNAREVIPT